MQLKGKRILLTGAAGGLGAALAFELAKSGAKLGLIDRHKSRLQQLADQLKAYAKISTCQADITNQGDQRTIVHSMYAAFGGTDIIINNAGIKEFIEYSEQKPEMMDKLLKVNVIAPMQLTRLLLPDMLCRESGHIVNIGSPFGTTASAYFTAYSASKFALRGFSEALRRELNSTQIKVTYISPRGIDTPIHGHALYNMAKAAKLQMDSPEYVAKIIVKAIEKEQKELYVGVNQSIVRRMNSIIPRFIDMLSARRNRVMREYTHRP